MIDIMKLKNKIIEEAKDCLVSSHEDLSEEQVHSALYNLDLIDYEDYDTSEEVFKHLEAEIAEDVDQSHFRCETCSWWFEHHEAGDEEGNCENCVDS